MKTRVHVTGVLFALWAFLAGALPGHAMTLVETQGSSFYSLTTDYGVFSTFQPVADVFVTADNVVIGGFGVSAAAEAAGQIRGVIFKDGGFVWQSNPIAVTGDNERKWFDFYLALGLGLEKNSTYSLGVISTNMFGWGRNTDADPGFGPIEANGLKILPGDAEAQFEVGENGQFPLKSTPILGHVGYDPLSYQTSVRVFDMSGPAPAVPEPAEWSLLFAGLLVIGFVANRRRRLSV